MIGIMKARKTVMQNCERQSRTAPITSLGFFEIKTFEIGGRARTIIALTA